MISQTLSVRERQDLPKNLAQSCFDSLTPTLCQKHKVAIYLSLFTKIILIRKLIF